MSLDDAFFGERRYEAADLEGHQWHFAERFENIRARAGREPEPGEMPTAKTSAVLRPGHLAAAERRLGLLLLLVRLASFT